MEIPQWVSSSSCPSAFSANSTLIFVAFATVSSSSEELELVSGGIELEFGLDDDVTNVPSVDFAGDWNLSRLRSGGSVNEVIKLGRGKGLDGSGGRVGGGVQMLLLVPNGEGVLQSLLAGP